MLDIVLLAMVAIFIALRLRSELGKKTGNEPLPPRADRTPYSADSGTTIDAEPLEVQPRDTEVVDLNQDPAVRAGLSDIRRADRYFDAGEFVEGAKSAYQMVLEAFWSGDKEALKDFLDETVLNQFSGAIDQRDQEGLSLENRLLEVTSAEIIGVTLVKRQAEITVHFSAEIIAVTRDAKGDVVDGDVSDAVDLEDKWTFARDVKARDPNWTLVATRAG